MELRLDGKRVTYERVGTGPPLAVLHGGLGHDHTYFRPYLDPLGDLVELVYIDLLGNGGSDDPEGLDGLTTLDPWIEQLHAMRAELGFDRWSVMGHSFGGIIAQAYALAHSVDVDRLVVCTSSSRVDHLDESFRVAGELATAEQLHTMTTELFEPMADNAEYERVWREVFPVYFADPTRADLDGVVDRMTVRAAAFNACLGLLGGIDFLPALGEFDAPTLVIGASRDWAFPPEVAPRRTAAALPNSTYVEIADAGHYPFIELPDEFLAAVRPWLVETDPATAAPRP